jgi:general L-amino acid transport system substrate-binding protein
MKRFVIVSVAVLLVGGFVFTATAGAEPTKVGVCHLDGVTGEFEPIEVPESSVAAHLAHGDVLIGDGVDENCDPLTGLAAVLGRGELRCGVNENAVGFGFRDEAGVWSGFDVDFCRVVAAAVLGDAEAVDYVPLTASERFAAVADGSVDVLIRNTTNTLFRDAELGISFGPTSFYDGQGFVARKDAGVTTDSTIADLPDGTRVCLVSDTTAERRFQDAADAAGKAFVFLFFDGIDAFFALLEGECDVYTSDRSALAGLISVFAANPDDWVIPAQTISKEPLAPAVAEGDDQWLDIVTWSFNVTFFADERGITSANIDAILAGDPDFDIAIAFGNVPGVDLGASLGLDAEWAYRVVKQVGNYGEIYERNLDSPGAPVSLVRAGSLNDSYVDGGLIYAPPIR